MKTIINKINENGRESILLSMIIYVFALCTYNDFLFIATYTICIGVFAINIKNEIYGCDINFIELSNKLNEEAEDYFERGRVFEGFIKAIILPLSFLVALGLIIGNIIVLLM